MLNFNLTRNRLLSAIAALWLVGVAAISAFTGETHAEPVKITMASSSTKKEWLNQAVAAFNEGSKTKRQLQFQGRPILVEVLLEEIEPGVRDHYRSGSMIKDILARVIEPTIASPAEQSWIQKLRGEWPGRKPIATDEGTGLLRTPLVIAMWRSRATSLGCWPTASPNCTWERLRVLASSTDGWGKFGHSEWGKLKYGYGFVGKSNSATFTEALNCMSGLQKRSGLTLDEVRADSRCGEAMAALEKAEIRIAEKSEWVLRDMRQKGPSYLDAVTTYEEEVIELNAEYGPTLAEQVVAVYPQDGTILATHPFTILDGAPWVTPEQAKAAEIFQGFLLSRQQQPVLLRYGFRPADVAAPLGPRIDPTYGANPQANLVLVDVPHSQVINAVVKLWEAIRAPKGEPAVVTHWSNGHLMRESLLPQMAAEFNKAGHRTGSGTRIVVEVHDVPSELQAKYLIPRVKSGRRIDLSRRSGIPIDPKIPDPTIVTPSDSHWLVTVNHEVGRAVVDLSAAQIIVRPVVGIVTYQEMAECLGWPEKKIGYADIIALRADPQGWASYPCARAEWGQRPLLAFTDPTTSSTGRSLLIALYSFAAGKLPEQLTLEDVKDPAVVDYVKQFQGLIDHYLIGTTVLNTKIYQGPRYGHFFIMPEDNLIALYEGTERAFINGKKVQAPPISQRMVMIYPKEGSMPRNNCACIIQADWVTEEQVEAAQRWIDFILEDGQQRAFMAAGFRPGTDLSLTDPASKINGRYGLDPTKPTVVLNPSLIDPAVAAFIDRSWEEVKKPGIVTFVVDISSSMKGAKLQQAKDGLIRALDSMARNNQVGLVTFNDTINTRIPVAPLAVNRLRVADAVHGARAQGEGALYEAIKAGVEMTDAADREEDAIRAVVVLTDGQANRCQTELDDLIQMMSRDEVAIAQFGGCQGDPLAVDKYGRGVQKKDLIGARLAMKTRYPIQIFFIGIGEDVDIEVGRMLAEATGAEFQGVTEKDLAKVLEEFSKYF